MRYLWDEAHGGHFSISGPFEECPELEVVAASVYDEAVRLLREALREMLHTVAKRNSFTDCVDRIDAFLTANGEAIEDSRPIKSVLKVRRIMVLGDIDGEFFRPQETYAMCFPASGDEKND
jgi:hypothetical protein